MFPKSPKSTGTCCPRGVGPGIAAKRFPRLFLQTVPPADRARTRYLREAVRSDSHGRVLCKAVSRNYTVALPKFSHWVGTMNPKQAQVPSGGLYPASGSASISEFWDLSWLLELRGLVVNSATPVEGQLQGGQAGPCSRKNETRRVLRWRLHNSLVFPCG